MQNKSTEVGEHEMKELIAHIRRELLRLRDLKDEYLRRLECLPEGKLKVDEKNGKKYYYHLLEGKTTYIGRKQSGLVERLQERRFAEDLDAAEEVCVYAKLPRGFQIPTPVGGYAPDWAIAFKAGAVKHVFFVAETKGSMSSLQLRGVEQAKIECARKLFSEMSDGDVRYDAVDSYESLLNLVR